MNALLAPEEKGLLESGTGFLVLMACQIPRVCESVRVFSIRDILRQGVPQFIFALSEQVPAWFLIVNLHLLIYIWGCLVIMVAEAANWVVFQLLHACHDC